ncbi:MAG: S-layer homology domain-containing protein [Clostridia bacterium]|nr:S-layer homology domain-containing protein [Clostridia bacterium]
MKRILCFMLVVSMFLPLGLLKVSAKEYTPYDMADFLNKLDIIHGDASKGGDYDLDSNLTRAQFAKIVVASSNYKNSVPIGTNTSPFADVPRTHWAAGYIKVAATNRLVTGYPDSTFRPDSYVLMEEAVTIALKLMGYTSEDFGSEWPYGQIGLATNIGILDNVDAKVGEHLTRKDAITIIYNTLNEEGKNGTTYIETLGYKLIEDVVLVSSYYQDASIKKDTVVTSLGTFNVKDNFDFSNIESQGDIIVKNNKDLVGFFADNKNEEVYAVAGVLSDDIIVNKNGRNEIINLSDDVITYYKNNQSTYSAVLPKITVGNSIKVIKDSSGQIRYIFVDDEDLKGPIRVSGVSIFATLPVNIDSATILKGGNKVNKNDININDIIYYSKNLNTIWAYSEKRTGIFEEAIPNQETPSSVKISGVTYEIEGIDAYTKFSSLGTLKLGQAVTVLLGKDGKIADILSGGASFETIYAYALSSGLKEYTVNNEKYTSYYISVATPDGNTYEFETSKTYDSLRGKVVKLTFKDEIATAQAVNYGGASGLFNYQSGYFGNLKIAPDISIIDVKDTKVSENGEYLKIYPPRLDGVTIKESDVLYCGKNEKGEISSLILKDVTGDLYKYGMIISASEIGGTRYLVDGVEKSTGTYFTFNAKTFGKFDIRNNQLEGIYAMSSVDNVEELSYGYLYDSKGVKHTISDNVTVYTVNSSFDYVLSTLTEAVTNFSKYRVQAFYDASDSSGGRVRIIILR